MKRVLLIAVAATLTMTAAAQVRPFIQAGIGGSEFWLQNAEGTEARFSYLVGAGVEIPVKNQFGIQPALMLVSKGADAPPSKNDNIETNIHLVYLEMPLDVTYRAAISDNWQVKVAAGPYFAYGIGGDTEVKTTRRHTTNGSFSGESPMRRFDAGLNVQVLFEYKRVFMGMNWDMGFIPIHKKEPALNNKTFPCNSTGALTVGLIM